MSPRGRNEGQRANKKAGNGQHALSGKITPTDQITPEATAEASNSVVAVGQGQKGQRKARNKSKGRKKKVADDGTTRSKKAKMKNEPLEAIKDREQEIVYYDQVSPAAFMGGLKANKANKTRG